MKMHGKWVLFLALTGLAVLSSCKDDDEISQDDAHRALESQGNVRVSDYGLFGTVKTFTKNSYKATWENNAIKKGILTEQGVVDFNEAGCVLSDKDYLVIVKSCKWSKDKSGDDVIVITDRELKLQYNKEYTFDSRNRQLSSLDERTSYTVTFGGYSISEWSMREDTIWVYSSSVDTKNTTFTLTSELYRGSKSQITYDDASRKATVITYNYNTNSKVYDENQKTVYDYNQFDRIDENSYESFPADKSAKSFNSNYDEKSVIQYDDQGNPSLHYKFYKQSPNGNEYSVSYYNEYTYVYY